MTLGLVFRGIPRERGGTQRKLGWRWGDKDRKDWSGPGRVSRLGDHGPWFVAQIPPGSPHCLSYTISHLIAFGSLVIKKWFLSLDLMGIQDKTML